MPFSSVQFCIYHFTLILFYLFNACCMACLEAIYQSYMAIVEVIIVPMVDALWTTESQIMRILCRLLLAPHSLILRRSLASRDEEVKIADAYYVRDVDFAVTTAAALFKQKGYCLPELVTFIKAYIMVIRSGIQLKIADGKRVQEKRLLDMVQTMYSRSLAQN